MNAETGASQPVPQKTITHTHPDPCIFLILSDRFVGENFPIDHFCKGLVNHNHCRGIAPMERGGLVRSILEEVIRSLPKVTRKEMSGREALHRWVPYWLLSLSIYVSIYIFF